MRKSRIKKGKITIAATSNLSAKRITELSSLSLMKIMAVEQQKTPNKSNIMRINIMNQEVEK